jgi:acetyl esterase/lipase
MTSYAVDAARRGYVGVTIDYRIRPGGGPVLDMAGDAYEDALAAVDWLKAHARTFGIDAEAVVAGGWSAGGVNALNLLYWPGERGPVDQSTVAGGVSIGSLGVGTPDADDPPALMHHGEADPIIGIDQGRATCDAANAAGSGCTFMAYPGDHSIAFTAPQLIQDRTADWVFENVLVPRGYRPQQAPG